MKGQRRHTDKPWSVTRRGFLKMGAQATVFTIVPAQVLGRSAPSNRINLGCIGTGNQGVQDMQGFLQHSDVQVVAVCDVNRGSYGYKTANQYRGREPGQKLVNAFYEKQRGSFKGCDAYVDFRELLARDDIDAVTVVTPDHWHAIMVVQAAKAGKHIYGEKPLTLTVADGPDMIEAVRRYNVVFQTGSHQRSRADARFACELVRNGRIGPLKQIKVYIGPNNKVSAASAWERMPIPDGFDYNRWLGPAPQAPYHQDRCLYTFRFILDYSGGQMTNLGAHNFDLAQWGNGTDLSGPVEIEDLGGTFPRDGLFDTATHIHFRAQYANGVEMRCQSRSDQENALPWGKQETVRFEGAEGWVAIKNAGIDGQPASLLQSTIGPNEIHLKESPGHIRNFLDCIKTGQDPVAPIELGHRSATMCHLGNIAMKLKTKLHWDPQAERFTNNEAANRLLSFPKRSGWES